MPPRKGIPKHDVLDPDEVFFSHLQGVDWERCWEWGGSRTAQGYGDFRGGGIHWLAHRYAYVRFVGPIPEGLVLDHVVCDNRGCCNPAHVLPSTHRENTGRANPILITYQHNLSLGKCLRGHDLTPENIYTRPNGQQRCRLCRREDKARFRERHRAG